MGVTICLNGRDMILEESLKLDKNVLLAVSRAQALGLFEEELWQKCSGIEVLVRHHLALAKSDVCDVLAQTKWRRRSFNARVLVSVEGPSAAHDVVFRCPMLRELSARSMPKWFCREDDL